MAADSSDETDKNTNGATPRTAWERLSATFLNPPKAKSPKPSDDAPKGVPLKDSEIRRQITLIDPLERKVGYFGAALAAIIALIATVPYIISPNTPVNKTLAA